MKRKFLWLLGILILMQIIRPNKNVSGLEEHNYATELNASREVKNLIKTSCGDCHSNHTNYPWYDKIAPVSWWVAGHINHAKEELNFEEWATYSLKRKKHKLEEIVEETEEGHMPLPSYLWMHGDAKLTKKQLSELKIFILTIE